MNLTTVPIDKPGDMNFILGHSHFIKTVEDLHEAIVQTNPSMKFGVAFCEASGPCLVRSSGNDGALIGLAEKNAAAIGAGHSFVIFMEGGFPVNILNTIKNVPEVCRIFCATANPVDGRNFFERSAISFKLPQSYSREDPMNAHRLHSMITIIALISFFLVAWTVPADAQKKQKPKTQTKEEVKEQPKEEQKVEEVTPALTTPSSGMPNKFIDVLKQYVGKKTNLGILKKFMGDYIVFEDDLTQILVPINNIQSARLIKDDESSPAELELKLISRD